MKVILIIVYLGAIILANWIAFTWGQNGIIITAFILIPFDFVLRAYFHEKWTGRLLWRNLLILVCSAALLSYILNPEMVSIAKASCFAFTGAGLAASVFYQRFMKRHIFFKVNGSDLVAVIVDSFIFQYLAFDDISLPVMLAQMTMKFTGGLVWYWILFKQLQINKNWRICTH